TAGGFFPDEAGAMMNVDFGQEFRSGRETAAVDQDVNWTGERGFAWLLDSQERIHDLVDFAVGSELSQTRWDSQVAVVVGELRETVTHATVLVDEEIVVVIERCDQEVGQQESPKLAFTPAVASQVQDERLGIFGLDGFKSAFHERPAFFHVLPKNGVSQTRDLPLVEKFQICELLASLVLRVERFCHPGQLIVF